MTSNNNNRKYFEDMLTEIDNKKISLEKKSAAISSLRAFCFFLGAALLIIGISDDITLAGIGGGLLLLIFVFLVKHHEKVSSELEHTVCKKESAYNYILRFSDGYRELTSDGSEYLTSEDTVAYDLDLLGKSSLYQLMCVCHSGLAKDKLAQHLKGNYIADNIALVNEAVEELIHDIDGAVEFEALGIKGEKNKKNKGGRLFFDFCRKTELSIPGWVKVISRIMPVIELILIILWLCGIVGYGYAAVGFFVLLGFSELTKGFTDSIVAPMLTASVITRDYLGMLEHIASCNYKSEYLKKIKEDVVGRTGTIVSYKKLSTISEAYKLSFNPVIYMLLNGIFLWNYRLAEIALKWKLKYGESAVKCEEIISDLEYLRSLAVLGIVRDASWAEIDTDENMVSMEFEELYHPLVLPEKVVENSACISSGITIITGSNMSGKTTFLRTIAVNLVLAYMGAPVCGKKLKADYMSIFTSMRVADDVANGISTFYAEILRIKNMAEFKKQNKPMLCMIDEIFKGTNSADRIVGAKEAVRRLSGKNSIVMVSTHDFELCSIEDEDGTQAVNYHFEEYYEGGILKFDYRLKDNRCTTTNAKAILRMAGFDV